MKDSKSVTNVSKPTHFSKWMARYDDMNYPGNRFDIQDRPLYYIVNYSGVARQHDKWLAIRAAVRAGIEHVLSNNPDDALSSAMDDLQHWCWSATGGFACQHMPWRVIVPHDLYRAFIYALRAPDSAKGNAAYASIRRYGSWF